MNFDISSLDWAKMDNLIPTIIQDKQGQVLTLAYSSRESLKKAISTQKGWYYSRSNERLWQKGETSGNIQELLSVTTDCDRDSLIFTVNQTGPACHKKTYSCFGKKAFSLSKLWELLRVRKLNPDENSYASSLFTSRKGATNKISEKLGEEAFELVLAAKDDDKKNIILEAADLVFFINMLLAEKNIPFGDVMKELDQRSSSK